MIYLILNARCLIILLDSRTFVRTTSELVIIFLKLLFVEKIPRFIDHMHPVYVHIIIAGVVVEICLNVLFYVPVVSLGVGHGALHQGWNGPAGRSVGDCGQQL